MLGCCKYGKNAFLELMTDHSFTDTLITYIDESSELIEVADDFKIPKAPRRTKFEIELLNIVVSQLEKKYNDTTSVFAMNNQNNIRFTSKHMVRGLAHTGLFIVKIISSLIMMCTKGSCGTIVYLKNAHLLKHLWQF